MSPIPTAVPFGCPGRRTIALTLTLTDVGDCRTVTCRITTAWATIVTSGILITLNYKAVSLREYVQGVDDVPVGADAFRSLMAKWPSGVAVLTVLGEHHVKSALITSFASASLNPPLVQVGLARGSRTHAALTTAPGLHVMVSMLAERVDDDRESLIQSVEQAAEEGNLAENPAVMSSALCTVHDVFAAGDHDIFLLAVKSTHEQQDVQPAIYHDHVFRRLAGVGSTLSPPATHNGREVCRAESMQTPIVRTNHD